MMQKKRMRISITLWVFAICLILNLIGFWTIKHYALAAAKTVVLEHEKIDLGDDSNVTIGGLRRQLTNLRHELTLLKEDEQANQSTIAKLKSKPYVFHVLEFPQKLGVTAPESLESPTDFTTFIDRCFRSNGPLISPPLLSRSDNAEDERRHVVFYGGIRISNPVTKSQKVFAIGIRPDSFNKFLWSSRHITFLLNGRSGNSKAPIGIVWPTRPLGDQSKKHLEKMQADFSNWWAADGRKSEEKERGQPPQEENFDPDFEYFHCLSHKIDIGDVKEDKLSDVGNHVRDRLGLRKIAITPPTLTDARFRIRYHDEADFEMITQELKDAPEAEDLTSDQKELLARIVNCQWYKPLPCHEGRYIFHRSRVVLNPSQSLASQDYFDVFNGVSNLELENDAELAVSDRVSKPFWVVVCVLVSCALGLSFYITRPIQQITKAARKVADEGVESPVEGNLPIHNRSEIGELAQTFKALLLGSRERTRKLVEQANLLTEKSERLSEGQGRLRGILDTAAEGIITVDQNENIRQANFAAKKLMGYEQRRQIEGKRLSDVLISASTGHGFCFSDQLEKSTSSIFNLRERYLLRQRTPDGTFRDIPVEVCISRFNDQKELNFTFIIRDIREQLRTEAELAEMVREKTQELEQALALRSQGLSQIIHELRVPLFAVKSSLNHLDSRFGEDPSLGVPDAISGAERMHQVIESLRTLKLLSVEEDPDQSTFRLLRFESLIDEAMQSLVRKIESIRLDRVCINADPDLPWIEGQPDAFREVLLNLISNACKYTRQDETGTVDVCVRELDSSTTWPQGAIRVEVSDNGIGIGEPDKDRIFHEFFRSEDASQRDPNGLGIGLAICRLFVERHHGKIDFESRGRNEGTTFWFEVPLRRPRQMDPDQLERFREPTRQALADTCLLLGSAVETVEVIMTERAEQVGLELKIESDAEDLLEELKQAKTAPYRLIFLTPHIESLNGFLTARAIHELDGYEEVFLVIVGPHSRKNAREEAGDHWYEHPRCAYMAEHELLDEMQFWKIAYLGVLHPTTDQLGQDSPEEGDRVDNF